MVIEEGVKIVETAGRNPGKYIQKFKAAGVTVVHKCVAVRTKPHPRTMEPRVQRPSHTMSEFVCERATIQLVRSLCGTLCGCINARSFG